MPADQQGATCEGDGHGVAYFYIQDTGLYLYDGRTTKPQQIYVDRSGMGEFSSQYFTHLRNICINLTITRPGQGRLPLRRRAAPPLRRARGLGHGQARRFRLPQLPGLRADRVPGLPAQLVERLAQRQHHQPRWKRRLPGHEQHGPAQRETRELPVQLGVIRCTGGRHANILYNYSTIIEPLLGIYWRDGVWVVLHILAAAYMSVCLLDEYSFLHRCCDIGQWRQTSTSITFITTLPHL